MKHTKKTGTYMLMGILATLWIAMLIHMYTSYRSAGQIKNFQIGECGRNARQYSLDQTKEFSKNPILSNPGQLERAQTDLYLDYLEKCFSRHNLIEGK